VVLLHPKRGYLKRMPVSEFEAPAGNRGSQETRSRGKRPYGCFIRCNDQTPCCSFSDRGVVVRRARYRFRWASRTQGDPGGELLPIPARSRSPPAGPSAPLKTTSSLLMLTVGGFIKQHRLSAFAKPPLQWPDRKSA